MVTLIIAIVALLMAICSIMLHSKNIQLWREHIKIHLDDLDPISTKTFEGEGKV